MDVPSTDTCPGTYQLCYRKKSDLVIPFTVSLDERVKILSVKHMGFFTTEKRDSK